MERRLGLANESLEKTASNLAWWPAVALTDGPDSLIPVSAVRTTLIEAVTYRLCVWPVRCNRPYMLLM